MKQEIKIKDKFSELFRSFLEMGNIIQMNTGERYCKLPFWFKFLDNGNLEIIEYDKDIPKALVEMDKETFIKDILNVNIYYKNETQDNI